MASESSGLPPTYCCLNSHSNLRCTVCGEGHPLVLQMLESFAVTPSVLRPREYTPRSMFGGSPKQGSTAKGKSQFDSLIERLAPHIQGREALPAKNAGSSQPSPANVAEAQLNRSQSVKRRCVEGVRSSPVIPHNTTNPFLRLKYGLDPLPVQKKILEKAAVAPSVETAPKVPVPTSVTNVPQSQVTIALQNAAGAQRHSVDSKPGLAARAERQQWGDGELPSQAYVDWLWNFLGPNEQAALGALFAKFEAHRGQYRESAVTTRLNREARTQVVNEIMEILTHHEQIAVGVNKDGAEPVLDG